MESVFFIGTDIGTSGTKSVLVDQSGKVLASALEEYGVIIPEAKWAEQDADVWLEAAKRTIKSVVKDSHVPKESIKSMCISGLYGGSGVPLDDSMQPVRPCIIWLDRRAAAECKEIRNIISEEELFKITGNGIDEYFGFSKILWIKHNEPKNWERISMFLPPNQYVVYRLTGRAVIDFTSAGNLGGIYDLRNHDWAHSLMERMGIPKTMMPATLCSPEEVMGTLTEASAEALGLSTETKVCAGCIDCLASMLAAGALDPGQHVAIIGTSINWGVIHNEFPSNITYITMPYAKDPKNMFYTYGGASTAGALPKWFRDNILATVINERGEYVKTNYALLDKLAEDVPAGSNGLIVLPYFMGERSPIWDANAKGLMLGLTLQHTGAHIYRALLESVAYSLRHIMDTSNIQLTDTSNCILVGGASRSKVWKQIIADVTGIPVVASSQSVEAPLGDALIAGIGAEYLDGYAVIKSWVDFDETTKPIPGNHEIYTKYYEIYKRLYPELKNDMAALSMLAGRFPGSGN